MPSDPIFRWREKERRVVGKRKGKKWRVKYKGDKIKRCVLATQRYEFLVESAYFLEK